MRDFDLVVAGTLPRLWEVLAENEDARLVAGATDFIPFLRAGKWQPRVAVDISRLDELKYLREVDGRVEIGALTTHAELAGSPLLQKHAPVLVEAAAQVADAQIRARGTLGGNICTCSPAADTAPALLVLEAEAVLLSREGERRVPITDFMLGPSCTALSPAEILAGVSFPVPEPGAGMAFLKLGRRKAMSISIVNAAALLEREGDKIRRGKLALGAVAPTPVCCSTAEKMLAGGLPGEELFTRVAGRVLEAIRPIDDIRAGAEYRRVVSVALARRALVQAWERTRNGGQEHR